MLKKSEKHDRTYYSVATYVYTFKETISISFTFYRNKNMSNVKVLKDYFEIS